MTNPNNLTLDQGKLNFSRIINEDEETDAVQSTLATMKN